MAVNDFPEPPDYRLDPEGFMSWARSLHNGVYGINEGGGNLNNTNMEEDLLTVAAVKTELNMDDPGNTTDVSDVAVQFNLLLVELRTAGLLT